MLVNVKVKEGDRTRVQAYEGVCIARSGGGLNENFTVRKISYGEGVERVFPLYAPMIDSIKVVRRGKVRRAKLYYLRGRARQDRPASPRSQGRHGGGAEGGQGSRRSNRALHRRIEPKAGLSGLFSCAGRDAASLRLKSSNCYMAGHERPTGQCACTRLRAAGP